MAKLVIYHEKPSDEDKEKIIRLRFNSENPSEIRVSLVDENGHRVVQGSILSFIAFANGKIALQLHPSVSDNFVALDKRGRIRVV